MCRARVDTGPIATPRKTRRAAHTQQLVAAADLASPLRPAHLPSGAGRHVSTSASPATAQARQGVRSTSGLAAEREHGLGAGDDMGADAAVAVEEHGHGRAAGTENPSGLEGVVEQDEGAKPFRSGFLVLT